jgi:AmiR/NasT family two-component response regulator
MKLPQDYVLVLDERQRLAQNSDLPDISDQYSFVIASSAEHAVEQARQVNPCLVILVGEDHHWFENQVKALRRSSETPCMTIVALTESASPRWQASKETLELDGFLVKPLTDDILVSLVQSAIIKQSYR